MLSLVPTRFSVLQVHFTRILSIGFFLILSALGTASTTPAAEITLNWDASPGETPAGYRVYRHVEGGSYDFTDPAWEGTSTTCTIYGLVVDTTHYFVVRAYDSSNNESSSSNEVSFTAYALLISASSDRANAGLLDGMTVDETVYIFVSPSTGIDRVNFFVDDPEMNHAAYHVEEVTAYDLVGTRGDGTAFGYDTTGLSDGLHEITALVETSSGENQYISATFTVDNPSGSGETSSGSQLDPGTDPSADQDPAEEDTTQSDGTSLDTVMLVDLSIVGAASISENTAYQYEATAAFSDGTTRTVTEWVSWSDDASYTSVAEAGLLQAFDVDSDEMVTLTAEYTYENVTERVQKHVAILDVPLSNLAPARPIVVTPYHGQVACSPHLDIVCEPFSDPDGDIQSKARWQISGDADFSSVLLDVTSSKQLTEFPVPHMLLDQDTTYYVRVRNYDVYLKASPWSETVAFTTRADRADADGNGIADEQDVDYTVDLDGNGIVDLTEPDRIKTIKNPDTGLSIGISKASGAGEDIEAIETAAVIDPSTIDDNLDRPARLDFGLFGYRLRVQHGATAQVTIYFSEDIPLDSVFYMYDTLRGWREYSENVVFHDDRRSITVTLTDGGAGDSDGIQNGFIVDPGGIGASTASSDTDTLLSSSGSGGGGGCFVSTLPGASGLHDSGAEDVWCIESFSSQVFCRIAAPVVDVRNVLVHTFGTSGTLFGLLFVGITLAYLVIKESTVPKAR